MFLEFPNLDALQLALTSGAIPAEVAGAAAEFGVADDGRVFVSVAGKFRREDAARLKELGVAGRKKSPVEMQRSVTCWPEILPLRRDESNVVVTEKTPVLFDLPDDGTLAEVVNEMLRLGNDRQSFRRIVADAASVGADAGSVRHGGESRVLLRVVGPPYYSLLRALDRESGDPGRMRHRRAIQGGDAAPRAFVERHSGVWVEAGYSHPLEEHLQSPPGKLLLLRFPHDWAQLDEAPFRDVYDVLEFDVPDSATRTLPASGSLFSSTRMPQSISCRSTGIQIPSSRISVSWFVVEWKSSGNAPSMSASTVRQSDWCTGTTPWSSISSRICSSSSADGAETRKRA